MRYEISPSGRAECYDCGHKIPKGVKRGYTLGWRGYGSQKRCYCMTCIKNNYSYEDVEPEVSEWKSFIESGQQMR